MVMTVVDSVGATPEQIFDGLVAETARFTQEPDGPWLFASFVFETLKGEIELVLPEYRQLIAVSRTGHMTRAEQLVAFAYDSPDSNTEFRDKLTRARDDRFFITRSPGLGSQMEARKSLVYPRAKSDTTRDRAFQAVRATEHWQGIRAAVSSQRQDIDYSPRRPTYFI